MAETLKHSIEAAVLAQTAAYGQNRQESPRLHDPMVIQAYAKNLVESGRPWVMIGMEASLVFLGLIPKEGLTAVPGVSSYTYSQKKHWLEEGY